MKCIDEECSKEAKACKLCWMHYKRQQVSKNKEAYNDYHKNYQVKIRDKVNEYHQTDAYKESHKKSQAKYYLGKVK